MRPCPLEFLVSHNMMKSYSKEDRLVSTNFCVTTPLPRLYALSLLVLFVFAGASGAYAQNARPRKLPSPDKLVGDYLKAVGGKKRQAAVRDATYEWIVHQGTGRAQDVGTARTYTKFPASTRTDIALGGSETNAAANARSAWLRSTDAELRTLTDKDANVAKLLSALNASRLVDYKRQDVLARTVAFFAGAPREGIDSTYEVEFSRRNGARLHYWFNSDNNLLTRVVDYTREISIDYRNYRATEGGLVEPHQLLISERNGGVGTVLTLKGVRYNTGLSDALFEPPSDSSLNISELLRTVARNQDELDRRVSDYTFTRTETEREIDDKGVVKKEKTRVHEIYPVAGGGRALKLISEDGVPLSPERLAEEEREVVETIKRIERENAKRMEKKERDRAAKAERARKRGETGAGADGDEEVGIGVFLRACEFISPRRENFRGREAIVFDFRPRPNFKPTNRGESIIGKLAGVAWIDPVDRQVMRLEARLAEGFKIGGGLVASVRPGSAVVMEQTRLEDGVWLPRFSQINASAKVFLFAGFRLNATREYSNYRRFSTSVGDAKVEAPPATTPPDEH
ncbi:MAG TPA: hypothetical protein VGW12_21955 [Pyrinomonadaceae bacterium]|nr:hypothetical protein [Pyrinomonadaceae bacterium]